MLGALRTLASRFTPTPPDVSAEQPTSEDIAAATLVARSFRRPFFRQGILLFGHGERLMVAVKNLSKTGARVEFFARCELPATVVLCEPTLRLHAEAQIVWSREGMAGLRFAECAATGSPTTLLSQSDSSAPT